QVNCQTCDSTIPYARCSTNSACGCLPMVGADNIGICAFLWKFCSQLLPCGSSQGCSEPDHVCVQHSRCSNKPLCYPVSMMNDNICPPQLTVMNTTMATIATTTTTVTINNTVIKSKFQQYGTIVAGGHRNGDKLDHISGPHRFFIDENKAITMLDSWKNRVIKWKSNEKQGAIVAGGNGKGNRIDQFDGPS
ncbi:unnamed protein product, partial [Adineta ricciae]